MEAFIKEIQAKYGYSDFDIAKAKYMILTFLSESSKILFLFICALIAGRVIELCIALAVLLPLRIYCGGIHCLHYWSCFLLSFAFTAACVLLPEWYYPSASACIVILYGCILIHYYTGPVPSIYRKTPTETEVRSSKRKSFVFLFFYALLIHVVGINDYTAVGFWTIVLQTAQLAAGYGIRREGKSCLVE